MASLPLGSSPPTTFLASLPLVPQLPTAAMHSLPHVSPPSITAVASLSLVPQPPAATMQSLPSASSALIAAMVSLPPDPQPTTPAMASLTPDPQLPAVVIASLPNVRQRGPGRRSKFTYEEDMPILREVSACKAHIAVTGAIRGRFDIAASKYKYAY